MGQGCHFKDRWHLCSKDKGNRWDHESEKIRARRPLHDLVPTGEMPSSHSDSCFSLVLISIFIRMCSPIYLHLI